ncbi:hypothetical protein ACFLR5_00635 [Elusimicrobiota bacterium]
MKTNILFLFITISVLNICPLNAEKEFIAVTDFSGFNVLQSDATIFSNYVRNYLFSKDFFYIAGKSELDDIIRTRTDAEEKLTVQEAIDIGEKLGVNKIIMGSVSKFTKLGDYYYISADIIDVKTGRVYISEDVECEDIDDFKEASREVALRIIKKMGYGLPESGKGEKPKKKIFNERYNKLGIGLGYPHFSIIWGLFPSWNIQPKFCFGSGIFTVGSRINYRIKYWDRFELYTGLDYFYITYKGEGLEGTGSMLEPFIGGSYFPKDNLSFCLDMGPAYIFLREREQGYYIKKFGDIIINLELRLFL